MRATALAASFLCAGCATLEAHQTGWRTDAQTAAVEPRTSEHVEQLMLACANLGPGCEGDVLGNEAFGETRPGPRCRLTRADAQRIGYEVGSRAFQDMGYTVAAPAHTPTSVAFRALPLVGQEPRYTVVVDASSPLLQIQTAVCPVEVRVVAYVRNPVTGKWITRKNSATASVSSMIYNHLQVLDY
ncbi:MAG TPA: hypothetical protein VEZ41_02620 [Allosphingosinicella sp.]|nr:hypothetical protein [Allosphingosinicella sp.]